MTQAIIAALIAAAASIICQLIISSREKAKDALTRAIRQKELDTAIEDLKKRVTDHNNYAKMFQESTKSINQLASDVKLLAVDVKYLKDGFFNGHHREK